AGPRHPEGEAGRDRRGAGAVPADRRALPGGRPGPGGPGAPGPAPLKAEIACSIRPSARMLPGASLTARWAAKRCSPRPGTVTGPGRYSRVVLAHGVVGGSAGRGAP